MKLFRGISLLILLTVLAACGTRAIPNTGQAVRIGSNDTTQDLLVAEMYAQVLSANDIPVERKLNLGNDQAVHNALVQKQIDLYPELTNTAYLTVMEMKDGEKDAAMILEKVRKYYERRWKITWLKAAPASDAIAPVVWQDVIENYPQMSELLDKVSAELTTDAISALVKKVDSNQQGYSQAARDFLTEKGLLP